MSNKTGDLRPLISQNPLQKYKENFDYEIFCKKTFRIPLYLVEIQFYSFFSKCSFPYSSTLNPAVRDPFF